MDHHHHHHHHHRMTAPNSEPRGFSFKDKPSVDKALSTPSAQNQAETVAADVGHGMETAEGTAMSRVVPELREMCAAKTRPSALIQRGFAAAIRCL